MVTSVLEKQKTLGLVKQRYIGREDLSSSKDESDDIADYSYFAEADDEEIDPPKKGEEVTGVIIEIDENGALIEIGGKMSGYLPVKEASLSPIKNINTLYSVGDSITGEMVGTLKGMPVISLRSAQLVVAWQEALKVRAVDEIISVKVLEVNRGGIVCDLFGLKAFIPGSHYTGTADASLIGTTLQVKFLDANEEEGKIVLSQRRALLDNQAADLKRGSVVSGTVTGLRQYGVFVELSGGLAGLLHISQISVDRIESLENLFTIGQKCKVMILDHDKTNNRVALSTKVLEPNPGDMLRDMNAVFAQAEETARKYHERLEAERLTRETAALGIVAGLDDSISNLSGNSVDPLVSVADSIESILASIVSNNTVNSSK